MTPKQIEIVRSGWKTLSIVDPVLIGEPFYDRLFHIAPEVKPLFRNPIPEQSRKLISMIGYVISQLDTLDNIKDEVAKLAQRHVHYGVKEEHYFAVGSALLWTLEKGLSGSWNEEAEQAWVACYTTLSSAMMSAPASDSKAA